MRRGTDSTQFIIYQSSIGLLVNCVWNKGQFMSHASKWVMYQRSQDSLLVKCRTHDKKVASSNPSRSGGRIFFSRVIFVLWLLFGVCSTPVLPQWQVKDPGHSAKCAGGRLHLNTHTPLTQQSPSRLTIPLFRQCGNLHGNKLTSNLSGNTQSQSSQLAEPLWTDPGRVRKLIST